jgi:hypothetical protein
VTIQVTAVGQIHILEGDEVLRITHSMTLD